jgi:hypothetical protein
MMPTIGTEELRYGTNPQRAGALRVGAVAQFLGQILPLHRSGELRRDDADHRHRGTGEGPGDGVRVERQPDRLPHAQIVQRGTREIEVQQVEAAGRGGVEHGLRRAGAHRRVPARRAHALDHVHLA